jgi:hypothetical protein
VDRNIDGKHSPTLWWKRKHERDNQTRVQDMSEGTGGPFPIGKYGYPVSEVAYLIANPKRRMLCIQE